MSTEPLSPNVTARICRHMNADHPEALIQLAKRYGGMPTPKKVKMIDITAIAMTLEVDGEFLEILFDHKLADSSDAHKSLVAMLQEIRRTS